MPSLKSVFGAKLLRSLGIAAVIFCGVVCPMPMNAQQRPMADRQAGSPEIAMTFDLERAKVANVGCGCFWLKGGSIDLSLPLYRGWSVAGSFGGGHAGNIRPGVDLSKVTYMAGPRYTLAAARGPAIYGEALFGGAHGFDSLFPAANAAQSSANSYAMQFGGGMNLRLSGGVGLRVVEVDYVRTALPNNGNNTQNDLRLAFGISYRFHAK